MASQELVDKVKGFDRQLLTDQKNGGSLAREESTLQIYTHCVITALHVENDPEYGLKLSKRVKNMINAWAKTFGYSDIFAIEKRAKEVGSKVNPVEFYYQVLYCESHYLFDSYLLYLEKNREFKDKFYLPRRKCLIKTGVIDGFQKMRDDELDLLTISMPPGVGKTTLEKFFLSWICGLYPDDYNLFYSHSGDITKMFYDGMLDILTSDEYTWRDIFNGYQVTNTNAKLEQINIGKYAPFPNVQCTSVGSKNAGKVRVSPKGYLLCDDMIGGIEEALNKNILDKLWGIYSVDARQRKLDGAKELHIATRWSVHDVIGRLETAFESDDRAEFIAIPDIDPETGKSNFAYDVGGFSEDFFHSQEKLMDDISYRCLYKSEPIEREGLLYHEDDLRRYMDLPQGEPDAILSVCDTKNKGTDYLVCPVFLVYGSDHYMVDCVCTDSSDYGVQYGRLANLLVDNKAQQCEFESNNGGDRVAYEVEAKIKELGARCNVTTKPTESNKETRIIVNADWVKKNVLFKDKSLYTVKSDYGVFMKWLLSYSVTGKNVHDDVPDCMANYALYVDRRLGSIAVVTSRLF